MRWPSPGGTPTRPPVRSRKHSGEPIRWARPTTSSEGRSGTNGEGRSTSSDSDAPGRIATRRRVASAHPPRDDRHRTEAVLDAARTVKAGRATPKDEILVVRLEKVTGVGIAELGNAAKGWREVQC